VASETNATYRPFALTWASRLAPFACPPEEGTLILRIEPLLRSSR
jgi:hypothetical protein